MSFWIVFWVLGIIFFFIEWWFLTHLCEQVGSYSRGYSWERKSFKVIHLILLVILNVIPIANVVGFVMILCIPVIEEDTYFKLIPPGKDEDTISKLDKLLNKEL